MTTTFFTSDLHFGHHKVAEYRGFDNSDDHDRAVVANWKRMVGDSDTVWVLGDLTCDDRKLRSALTAIAYLPGTKHLIAGNHDACHPMHRKAHKWQRDYLQVFESVQAFAKRRINGQDILLSHFPYVGDHTTIARYEQYRLRDAGLPLIHGHTHDSCKRSFTTEDALQLHVGLDAWDLQLVSESQVIAEFEHMGLWDKEDDD